jgi:hypothetical protein
MLKNIFLTFLFVFSMMPHSYAMSEEKQKKPDMWGFFALHFFTTKPQKLVNLARHIRYGTNPNNKQYKCFEDVIHCDYENNDAPLPTTQQPTDPIKSNELYGSGGPYRGISITPKPYANMTYDYAKYKNHKYADMTQNQYTQKQQKKLNDRSKHGLLFLLGGATNFIESYLVFTNDGWSGNKLLGTVTAGLCTYSMVTGCYNSYKAFKALSKKNKDFNALKTNTELILKRLDEIKYPFGKPQQNNHRE